MSDQSHYRHDLDEALAAFGVRDRWDAADPNEQLAVLKWLEATPSEHVTRRARRVAQWLSADHPLVARTIERRWPLPRRPLVADIEPEDADTGDEPVSEEVPAGLEPEEPLTAELQRRVAARTTWAALADADRQSLRAYVMSARTSRGQAHRAREIRGVLWSGAASVRAWLDFFNSPDGYRAMEGSLLKPMSRG